LCAKYPRESPNISDIKITMEMEMNLPPSKRRLNQAILNIKEGESPSKALWIHKTTLSR
jgi:hypothetical protein